MKKVGDLPPPEEEHLDPIMKEIKDQMAKEIKDLKAEIVDVKAQSQEEIR